jgi:phosphoribosylformimino-5-aminoimidazole carboxamide ribotide isomerase
MLVLPAIDIRGGQCVRLKQGDYSRETVYGNPVEVARQWLDQGAQYLHLVDLDGARAGKPVNLDVIESLTKLASTFQVPCQLGGGLRTEADLATAFELGITRAIVGTKAILEPDWLAEMVRQFPNQLVLGLDAHNGKLAVSGWESGTDVEATDFLGSIPQSQLAAVVYTDISRDGMLSGPNFEATERLAKKAHVPVIASGGISSMEDVLELARRGIPACILGRSLYERTVNLPALLERLSA